MLLRGLNTVADVADLALLGLTVGPKIIEAIKNKKLPSAADFKEVAKGFTDIGEEFKQTLNDEIGIADALDAMTNGGQEERSNIIRAFLLAPTIPKRDKILLRKIAFTVQKANGPEAVVARLVKIAEGKTFASIQAELAIYRQTESSFADLTPEEAADLLKQGWEKLSGNRRMRVTAKIVARKVKRADRQVTDEALNTAKAELDETVDGLKAALSKFKLF